MDLLITDVVLPDINGRQLADRLIEIRPAMKVHYMSGYTAEVIEHYGVFDDSTRFIAKPFTAKALKSAVREALEAGWLRRRNAAMRSGSGSGRRECLMTSS